MRATIIIETDEGQVLVFAPSPKNTISITFETPREFVQYPNYDTGCMVSELTGVMTLNVSVRGKTPAGGLWHDAKSARELLTKIAWRLRGKAMRQDQAP